MANSADVRALTEEFYAIRNTEDPVGEILSRFAPDGCYQILGPARLGAFTQRCEGHDAVRVAATQLVGDWDLSRLANVIYVDGNTTLTHRKGTVRFNPTNREFETEFIDKMTFRDGKIVEYVQFLDTLGIAEAVGMVNFAEA